MRYIDIITESVPTSIEFKQWFAGSKVVDKNGQPLRMFHGTYREFDLPLQQFTHFGTVDAATERMFGKSKNSDMLHFRPTARLYPVFLSIKNPYTFTDLKNTGYSDVLRKMFRDEIIQPQELDELKKSIITNKSSWISKSYLPINNKWKNPIFLQKICGGFIIERLSKFGYDGLKYKNNFEDIGSISWVTFHSNQIWHEFQ